MLDGKGLKAFTNEIIFESQSTPFGGYLDTQEGT